MKTYSIHLENQLMNSHILDAKFYKHTHYSKNKTKNCCIVNLFKWCTNSCYFLDGQKSRNRTVKMIYL